MIPLDAANVIGALGGIAELAKEALNQQSVRGAAPPTLPSRGS
jgi:hypothetical protein